MDTIPSNSKPELPELSEESVNTLKNLRDSDLPAFYAYVKSLRQSRWPLRAIATPLGVSRTAVSNWERAVPDSALLPATQGLPEALPKQVKPTYTKFELSDAQAQELKVLAHEASKVRRFTDPNAKSRDDAKRLEILLRSYASSGASLSQLAKACEVSRSSIAQRLRKPQNV